jgi:hypothetical protein
LYVPFTVPEGSTVVVICGAPSTVNVSDMDCPGNVTDVAFTISETDCPAPRAGAVYVTDVFVMLLRVPCAGVVQVTPAAEESFETAAVM